MNEKEFVIKTSRLGLRKWIEKDNPVFIQMNLDLQVMRYFPRILTPKQTLNFVKRINEHFEKHDYGLWAVEELDSNRFIGFIGLWEIPFEEDFTPGIEIGWRLAVEFWNKGYATEGARAVLDYAFTKLKLDKIYSFTSKINKVSIRVMEKIGLYPAGEFNHPNLDPLNQLSRHVLFSSTYEEYHSGKI